MLPSMSGEVIPISCYGMGTENMVRYSVDYGPVGAQDIIGIDSSQEILFGSAQIPYL